MHNIKPQELLEHLEAAFGGLPVPSDDSIVYDNSGDHLECNQIREKFRRRHWRDLTVDDLSGEADSLAFFTPEAFRFFLPAFIRVSIIEAEGADLIPDAILWKLARPSSAQLEPDLDSAAARRLELLDHEQRSAVKDFIAFLREHRRDDFNPEELDLAEEALRTPFPRMGS